MPGLVYAGPMGEARAEERGLVMGILNVTPDSFSDGGSWSDPERAIIKGHEMIAEGADIVDVGGESSRPGAVAVSIDEELERVIPVIEALSPHVRVSVDTVKEPVADAAVAAGATLINDVSASLWPVAARHGVGWVAMHCKGTPATMQDDPRYDDVVAEVRDLLSARAAAAAGAGVREIWIDPGIGFGKTMADNWRLVVRGHELADLGCPIVLGLSRKRFLATPPPEAAEEFAAALAHVEKFRPLAAHDRDLATAAATLLALRRGIRLHRVHNVALCRAAVAN